MFESLFCISNNCNLLTTKVHFLHWGSKPALRQGRFYSVVSLYPNLGNLSPNVLKIKENFIPLSSILRSYYLEVTLVDVSVSLDLLMESGMEPNLNVH